MNNTDREDRIAILKKLHRVMEAVNYIQKDGTNEFHHFKYASEANVTEHFRKEFIKAGLIPMVLCTDAISLPDGVVRGIFEIRLADVDTGYTLSYDVRGDGQDVAKSGKIGDKGIYKAYSGAVKYWLLKTFLVPTGLDADSESMNEKAEEVSSAHVPNPTEQAERDNLDRLAETQLATLDHLISSGVLADISVEKADRVIAYLNGPKTTPKTNALYAKVNSFLGENGINLSVWWKEQSGEGIF